MKSLQDLVDHYKQDAARKPSEDLKHFVGFTIEETIRKSVLSCYPQGTLHSHQRRIGRKRLIDALPAFLEETDRLENADSFDKIYTIIKNLCQKTFRLGNLFAYDLTSRIAAYKKLKPEFVYLHAGAKIGARRLGLSTRSRTLSKDHIANIHNELHDLDCDEIEDFLCRHKDLFQRLPNNRSISASFSST